MKIEVRIEEGVTEPKLVIIADRMTDELSDLVRRLSGGEVTALAGFRGEEAKLIGEEDIIRVYASEGKVFAVTDDGEYRLRLRLYELEDRLPSRSFVRISNAEIVNIKRCAGSTCRLPARYACPSQTARRHTPPADMFPKSNRYSDYEVIIC